MYLRGHWVDLIALIPVIPALLGNPSLDLLRFLRLLRLLRLVRVFSGVYRALVDIEQIARYRGVAGLVAIWLSVVAICTMGFYLAEINAPDTKVRGPLDALWWGLVSMTTVGYGDVFPVTATGKLYAAALLIIGIALFSALTATMASRLVAIQTEAVSDDPSTLLRELAHLRDAGVITAEEFETKSTELVRRL